MFTPEKHSESFNGERGGEEGDSFLLCGLSFTIFDLVGNISSISTSPSLIKPDVLPKAEGLKLI